MLQLGSFLFIFLLFLSLCSVGEAAKIKIQKKDTSYKKALLRQSGIDSKVGIFVEVVGVEKSSKLKITWSHNGPSVGIFDLANFLSRINKQQERKILKKSHFFIKVSDENANLLEKFIGVQLASKRIFKLKYSRLLVFLIQYFSYLMIFVLFVVCCILGYRNLGYANASKSFLNSVGSGFMTVGIYLGTGCATLIGGLKAVLSFI